MRYRITYKASLQKQNAKKERKWKVNENLQPAKFSPQKLWSIRYAQSKYAAKVVYKSQSTVLYKCYVVHYVQNRRCSFSHAKTEAFWDNTTFYSRSIPHSYAISNVRIILCMAMHSLEVMYNIFNLYISKEWCQALDKSNTLRIAIFIFSMLFLFHTYDFFYDSQNMGLLKEHCWWHRDITLYLPLQPTCQFGNRIGLEIFGKKFWLEWTYVIQDKCRGLSIEFEQLHLLISKRRGLRILSSYLKAWPYCISKAWILHVRTVSWLQEVHPAKLYIGLMITGMCMHA